MTDSKLFLGDCLDVLKRVEDASVDFVLADLPYGTTKFKWDIRIPFEPLWKELHRVCKPNAAVIPLVLANSAVSIARRPSGGIL